MVDLQKKEELKKLEEDYLEKRKLYFDFKGGQHHLSFSEEANLIQELDELSEEIEQLKKEKNKK